ncbi:MAG TPA: hypothetical protein PLN94_13000 [Thiolinea sp.]|nr:hypothetical protein [Thiolinea sp.]
MKHNLAGLKPSTVCQCGGAGGKLLIRATQQPEVGSRHAADAFHGGACSHEGGGACATVQAAIQYRPGLQPVLPEKKPAQHLSHVPAAYQVECHADHGGCLVP